MSTTLSSASTPIVVDRSRIVLATVFAVIIAVVANVIVYFIGSSQGAIPATFLIEPMNQAITLVPVIFSSAFGVIAGSVFFFALTYITKNPVRWFVIIATLVLILSLGGPLTIKNAPSGMPVYLLFMHVITGLASIWAMATQTKQKA